MSEEEMLPRITAIEKVPVIGFLWRKTEDWLSGIRFVMMNDLLGFIAVVFYALIYAILALAITIARKQMIKQPKLEDIPPEVWFVAEGIAAIILCFMLLALMIRFVYERGDNFLHEFLPFSFVAVVTTFRAMQAAAYASCLATGIIAKLIQILPLLVFMCVFIIIVLCFIVCTIATLSEKKNNPVS
jgi:drug/metabolite transporter (DMT)-like permease